MKNVGQSGSVLQPDDPIFKLAGILEGPPDFAANHDHYIYRGSPSANQNGEKDDIPNGRPAKP